MKNISYKKEFNESGEFINEITKDSPFHNNNPSNRSKTTSSLKYITYHDGTKEKLHGNNRANNNLRGVNGRTNRF